ncbi:MAG: DUF3631 domain-containing protein, partial [Candidatus Riflebacteria bacterium]|nr:DUF3631 domain-containing protein [Candidatus Riflebacteria bacterium]
LMNSGHSRDSAFVLRVEEIEGRHTPVKFSTWCPKAYAGIRLEKKLPETILSRSVTVNMRKKLPGEKAEKVRHADPAPFVELKRKLKRWASDNGHKFGKMRPDMAGLTNRNEDNYEHLFAIADLAGGSWPTLVRKSTEEKGADPLTIDEELLQDVLLVFGDLNVKRVKTVDLIQKLTADPEGPWAAWNKGNPLRPRQLSEKLGAFGIHPTQERMPGTDNPVRGYNLSSFQDAKNRYLSQPTVKKGVLSVTPLQPHNDQRYSVSLSVTAENIVTDKETSKPSSTNDCNVVTAKRGVSELSGERAVESENFDRI